MDVKKKAPELCRASLIVKCEPETGIIDLDGGEPLDVKPVLHAIETSETKGLKGGIKVKCADEGEDVKDLKVHNATKTLDVKCEEVSGDGGNLKTVETMKSNCKFELKKDEVKVNENTHKHKVEKVEARSESIVQSTFGVNHGSTPPGDSIHPAEPTKTEGGSQSVSGANNAPKNMSAGPTLGFQDELSNTALRAAELHLKAAGATPVVTPVAPGTSHGITSLQNATESAANWNSGGSLAFLQSDLGGDDEFVGGKYEPADADSVEPDPKSITTKKEGKKGMTKTEKVEMVEKVENVENVKNAEDVQKVEKVEKIEKVEKLEKVEKGEKGEKVEKVEKVAKVEKVEIGNKVEKVEKKETVGGVGKPESLHTSGLEKEQFGLDNEALKKDDKNTSVKTLPEKDVVVVKKEVVQCENGPLQSKSAQDSNGHAIQNSDPQQRAVEFAVVSTPENQTSNVATHEEVVPTFDKCAVKVEPAVTDEAPLKHRSVPILQDQDTLDAIASANRVLAAAAEPRGTAPSIATQRIEPQTLSEVPSAIGGDPPTASVAATQDSIETRTESEPTLSIGACANQDGSCEPVSSAVVPAELGTRVRSSEETGELVGEGREDVPPSIVERQETLNRGDSGEPVASGGNSKSTQEAEPARVSKTCVPRFRSKPIPADRGSATGGSKVASSSIVADIPPPPRFGQRSVSNDIRDQHEPRLRARDRPDAPVYDSDEDARRFDPHEHMRNVASARVGVGPHGRSVGQMRGHKRSLVSGASIGESAQKRVRSSAASGSQPSGEGEHVNSSPDGDQSPGPSNGHGTNASLEAQKEELRGRGGGRGSFTPQTQGRYFRMNEGARSRIHHAVKEYEHVDANDRDELEWNVPPQQQLSVSPTKAAEDELVARELYEVLSDTDTKVHQRRQTNVFPNRAQAENVDAGVSSIEAGNGMETGYGVMEDGTPLDTSSEAFANQLLADVSLRMPPKYRTVKARTQLVREQVEDLMRHHRPKSDDTKRQNPVEVVFRTDLMHDETRLFIEGIFSVSFDRQLQVAVKEEVKKAKKRFGGRRRRANKQDLKRGWNVRQEPPPRRASEVKREPGSSGKPEHTMFQ